MRCGWPPLPARRDDKVVPVDGGAAASSAPGGAGRDQHTDRGGYRARRGQGHSQSGAVMSELGTASEGIYPRATRTKPDG